MSERPPPLTVHVDDEALELSPVTNEAGTTMTMRCPCGGTWIMAWAVDADGARIYSYAAMLVLHTAPACAPFDSLPPYDFHTFATTGRVPQRKPVVAGDPDARQPARALRHHR